MVDPGSNPCLHEFFYVEWVEFCSAFLEAPSFFPIKLLRVGDTSKEERAVIEHMISR